MGLASEVTDPNTGTCERWLGAPAELYLVCNGRNQKGSPERVTAVLTQPRPPTELQAAKQQQLPGKPPSPLPSWHARNRGAQIWDAEMIQLKCLKDSVFRWTSANLLTPRSGVFNQVMLMLNILFLLLYQSHHSSPLSNAEEGNVKAFRKTVKCYSTLLCTLNELCLEMIWASLSLMGCNKLRERDHFRPISSFCCCFLFVLSSADFITKVSRMWWFWCITFSTG